MATIMRGRWSKKSLMSRGTTRLFGEVVELSRADVICGISYEDTDDEDDNDAIKELSWRLDPKVSMSDWTLQVSVSHSSASSVLYHIHKSVLAVGPRRSRYLSVLFRRHQRKLGHNHGGTSLFPPHAVDDVVADWHHATSAFELPQIMADAVPVMLDFVYHGTLAINMSNARALHSLAHLFRIEPLQLGVQSFWHVDLTTENLPVYYKQACMLQDNDMLRRIEHYCAEYIFTAADNELTAILGALEPCTFLRVVSHDAMFHSAGETSSDDAISARLSLLIAFYATLHKRELDFGTFTALTNDTRLPVLDAKAAHVLVQLELDILGNESDMSSLKQRAIDALSLNWDTACFVEDETPTNDESNVTVKLPALKEHSLARFTAACLLQARKQLRSLAAEQAASVCQQFQVLDMTRQLEDMQFELQVVRERYERERKHLNLERQEQQRRIADFEEQRRVDDAMRSRKVSWSADLECFNAGLAKCQRRGYGQDMPLSLADIDEPPREW